MASVDLVMDCRYESSSCSVSSQQPDESLLKEKELTGGEVDLDVTRSVQGDACTMYSKVFPGGSSTRGSGP